MAYHRFRIRVCITKVSSAAKAVKSSYDSLRRLRELLTYFATVYDFDFRALWKIVASQERVAYLHGKSPLLLV